MEIHAIDFVYDTAVISKKQFDEHIKLYKGYVDKVNAITSQLASDGDRPAANATYSLYRGLKKGETYALDGVLLHELYFQNLSDGKTPMGKETTALLEKQFGSVENWMDDCKACSLSARGWCVLAYEQRTETFRNLLFDLHDDGPVMGAYPLIVLDMYEHAYFLDYGTDKAGYIQNLINGIDWSAVERRVKRLGRA